MTTSTTPPISEEEFRQREFVEDPEETERVRVQLAPAIQIGLHVWMGVALAGLAFLLMVYFIFAFNLFQFPFDYDQGEGFELWSAVMITNGELPYTDNSVFPFHSSLYGVVFPVIMAPFVAMFGPHLWIGRVWSFLATFVMAGVIYFIVQRETKLYLPAIIAALLFFASNTVYQVGPLFRQHTTMEMFGLLGILAISRFDESDHPHRNIVLALLCLLLAGFTKPLIFDTVAAVFAFMFLRRPLLTIPYAAAFGVATGIVFLGLNIATNGHWMVNIFSANANPFIDGQAALFYSQWFQLHTVIILISGAYFVYTLYVDRLNAYSLLFVFASAKGLLSGKWGAGPSYLMTAIIAAAICTGIVIGLTLQWVKQQRQPVAQAMWGLLVPLLLLAQVRLNFHLPLEHPLTRPVANILNIPDEFEHRFRQDYFDSVGYTQLGHLTHPEDIEAGQRIVAWAEQHPGPAWSEEAMFPILAGKEEVVGNPALLFNLGNSGILNTDQMVEMIYDQAFGVVIFRAQFYPQDVLNAIGQNYERVDVIEMNGFEYLILIPKEAE